MKCCTGTLKLLYRGSNQNEKHLYSVNYNITDTSLEQQYYNIAGKNKNRFLNCYFHEHHYTSYIILYRYLIADKQLILF